MTHPFIEITIPVLDEESRLTPGIETSLGFFRTQGWSDVHIAIADNGSTDRTESIGRELAEQHRNVRYLNVGQRGVGRALRRAWATSAARIVGYMDVDLATDLTHLQDIRRIFEDDTTNRIAIVNGSRLLPDSRVVNRSPLRELTSRGFNSVVQAVLAVHFTDGMCGFKFMRKHSFEQLLALGVENYDWFFCTELLVIAEWNGLPIREIPVYWTDDDDSRVRLPSTINKYMKEIIRLRRHGRPSRPHPRSLSGSSSRARR